MGEQIFIVLLLWLALQIPLGCFIAGMMQPSSSRTWTEAKLRLAPVRRRNRPHAAQSPPHFKEQRAL